MAKISRTVQELLLQILVEAFFFGVYLALFIFSTILLCKRPPSRMRYAMLAMTVIMYAASAAHLALSISLYLTFLEARLDNATAVFFLTYLPTINYILSDGIVLWRAWVLWNRKFLLFIPPLISIVRTVGITLASAIYYTRESAQVLFGKRVVPLQVLARALDFFVVGTNLWATGLIFIRHGSTDACCDRYLSNRHSGAILRKRLFS